MLPTPAYLLDIKKIFSLPLRTRIDIRHKTEGAVKDCKTSLTFISDYTQISKASRKGNRPLVSFIRTCTQAY